MDILDLKSCRIDRNVSSILEFLYTDITDFTVLISECETLLVFIKGDVVYGCLFIDDREISIEINTSVYTNTYITDEYLTSVLITRLFTTNINVRYYIAPDFYKYCDVNNYKNDSYESMQVNSTLLYEYIWDYLYRYSKHTYI